MLRTYVSISTYVSCKRRLAREGNRMIQLKALLVSTRAEYFRLELAEQLFKRGREVPLVGILAAVTCATLFQTPENKGALTIWAITFIALYAVSYLALFLPQRKPNTNTYAAWTRNFIWAFASYGVMWGVFTFICSRPWDSGRKWPCS